MGEVRARAGGCGVRRVSEGTIRMSAGGRRPGRGRRGADLGAPRPAASSAMPVGTGHAAGARGWGLPKTAAPPPGNPRRSVFHRMRPSSPPHFPETSPSPQRLTWSVPCSARTAARSTPGTPGGMREGLCQRTLPLEASSAETTPGSRRHTAARVVAHASLKPVPRSEACCGGSLPGLFRAFRARKPGLWREHHPGVPAAVGGEGSPCAPGGTLPWSWC